MEIDLHGYSPDDWGCRNGLESGSLLEKIVQQAWEMGEASLTLIHGHGRNRGITPGFVNTNTGYFGLCIRRALRHDESLRRWIKHTTLDYGHMGATTVALKANPTPTRTEMDCCPDRRFAHHLG